MDDECRESGNLVSLPEFFGTLFRPDDGYIELRALPCTHTEFVTLRDLNGMETFLRRHEQCCNIYFGVASRRAPGNGALSGCYQLSALWVDMDFKTIAEGDAWARLLRFPPSLGIVVNSGAGLHAYWLLREPVDVRAAAFRIKSILRRLAHHLGGDLRSAEPAHILRVPGTLNYKYTPPRQVYIEISAFEWRSSLEEIEALLSEEPPVSGGERSFTVPEPIYEGSRNETLYRLGRSLHAKGLSQPVIATTVRTVNAAQCEPPLPEDEVTHIAEHASTQADRPDFVEPSNGGTAVTITETVAPPHVDETWPQLPEEALHGLPGDIVKAVDPYTEADPVAVLAHVLAAFGNLVGPGPHFRVEHTTHPLRINFVLVGPTAKARKGTSWSTPRYMFGQVDPTWVDTSVTSGLSSGEGLIYAVRDLVEDNKGKIVDPGVEDKRLFVIEEEFSQPLKVMRREGNILSPTIRQTWDTGNLHPLTKNNPTRATGAHISIMGHITQEELLRHLSETEQANGFANRFIWLQVRRSKTISNPTGVPEYLLHPLALRLCEAHDFAREVGLIVRYRLAESLWAEVYPALSEGKPGLLGAILARAEAHVMRLACTYALLDCSAGVMPAHLKAALALWDYAEASAQRIFGDRLGNPVADRILAGLRLKRELDETEVHGLFGRHKSAGEVSQALDLLQRLRLAVPEMQQTGGRPRIVWRGANYAK